MTDELAADDAAILALENDSITGHTLKLALLEPSAAPLDVDALRASINSRLGAEARARQLVVTGADGRPGWVMDREFDVADHVARDETTDVDDDPTTALRRAASALMARRLDHGRPLWRFDVIGPLADGREAIVARIHHAMADGVTGLRFLDAVLWDAAPSSAASPPGAASVQRPAHRIRRLPGVLHRELGGRAEESPLDRHIGSARALAFSFLPLAVLRDIGHRRQDRATVNDVLLAVVAGALRRWSVLEGDRRRPLRAQIPVSLHHRDESRSQLGNSDSFLNVDLPIGEPDPMVRLDLVRAETAKRKRLGDAQEMYDLFHALARSRPLAAAVARREIAPRQASVSISNVPGPSDVRIVLGRTVEHLSSAAEPADRHALRISAISYAGTLGVGWCTDPNTLPGIDELPAALAAAFDELRDAAIE